MRFRSNSQNSLGPFKTKNNSTNEVIMNNQKNSDFLKLDWKFDF